MPRFRYILTVDTDTQAHADQVVVERTGFDEQYADENNLQFEYAIDTEAWGAMILSPEELEVLAANHEGNALEITVREPDGDDVMTYITADGADGFRLHVRVDRSGYPLPVEREVLA